LDPAGVFRPMRRISLLVAVPILVTACSLVPGASVAPRVERLEALAAHQAQWSALDLADYSFSVIRHCFCPEQAPIDVTVVDGRVTALERAGAPVLPDDVRSTPTTVPGLFQVVADQADAFELTVTWDPVFGFPTRIDVDAIENMVDEEFSIEVTDFRPAS
jgi:hypothetical protein